jgi:predicted transporter
MTNETLLSYIYIYIYIYILKNKEGKKKKQARERAFKPRPACLGLVLFLLLFYKDVDYLSFIPIFIYKKKTQTVCCLQAQILATTVVHETSGQPLFWLKKLNF